MPVTTPKDRVAANVRAEMARRRITQSQLASALDTTQAAVSRRLSGQVALDVDEVSRIASYLGVSVAALLDEPAGDAA